MGCYGFARPYRTDLARRLVTHRDDEIHSWCVCLGKFAPVFGPQTLYVVVPAAEQIQG